MRLNGYTTRPAYDTEHGMRCNQRIKDFSSEFPTIIILSHLHTIYTYHALSMGYASCTHLSDNRYYVRFSCKLLESLELITMDMDDPINVCD